MFYDFLPLMLTIKQVMLLSIFSRIIYIVLAYISNAMFEDFDKSTRIMSGGVFLKFLLRWDAIYFYEIIQKGYCKEHLLAFFPLFPYCVNFASKLLSTEVVSTAVLLNNTMFVLSSLLLHSITKKKYGFEIAKYTLLFFIFNPSSIIYCTLYSEPMYTFLFLLGYKLLERNNKYLAAVIISLTAITRSNGILNSILFFDSRSLFNSCLLIPLSLIPFILLQAKHHEILKLDSYTIPYAYIQKKYWEHGFLNFYTHKKNIPNTIIGLPFILFTLYCLVSFAYSKCYVKNKFTIRFFTNKENYYIVSFYVMLWIQTLMCIFFIHMQMFFRFISYNPLFYWFMAFMCKENSIIFRIIMFGYFYYGIAYAVLFGAYYPPA